MPYQITGKVLDSQGYPLLQVAQIDEQPFLGDIGGTAFTDENGEFTLLVLNSLSTITVSSYGYKTVEFTANAVPSEVRLADDPASVITITRPKKDNTLLWVGGGVLAIIAIYSAMKKNTPVKQIGKTVSKPALKAKTVIV